MTRPESTRLAGPFLPALTVDVEEWYHTCWIPEYNEPARRPGFRDELDHLLPDLAGELERTGARATFFVLGEVAARVAPRLRELAAAGHEIACHGFHHRRAGELSLARFGEEISRAKRLLEDLVGTGIAGYRSPEWSLRTPDNPRLRRVAEAGFAYDSSLMPAAGAGAPTNPTLPVRWRWPDGLELDEAPPLTWGGALRLPAGGWCGRVAAPRWILAAARGRLRAGGLPLLVVHPWELVDRPVPGLMTGFARFFHEASRQGFRERFRSTLAGLPWRTVSEALAQRRDPRSSREGVKMPESEVGKRW